MQKNTLTFLYIIFVLPTMLISLGSPSVTYAATINVNTLVDENDGCNTGNCSLREAIETANSDDVIEFSVSGTIDISANGELLINKNLTITGTMPITIDGVYIVRVFNITSGNVILDRLAIINGESAQNGGGIYNDGTLTVSYSTLGNNHAVLNGGGIYNQGMLTISNSTVSSNVSSNQGGGINNQGTLLINNSTISGNNATSTGGGIFNSDGTVDVNNSTISGNNAISTGGGIFNSDGTVDVNNSTITDNKSTTVSGGGGISSFGNGTTFTTLTNTIVSGNYSGGAAVADDLFLYNGSVDSFTSSGYNLIGRIWGGITAFVDGSNGDQTGINNPGIAPLGNNGGVTYTHSLLPNSLAVDAGNPGFLSGGYDQRGKGHNRVINARLDIGAYEAESYDCTVLPWQAGNQASLNAAIDCYNTRTFNNNYSISIMQNIPISANSIVIDNTVPGLSLQIEGGGHVLDVQGVQSVSPLTINTDTTVTIQNITIIGSSKGISNQGTLTVNNSTLNGNHIGISNQGALTVNSSTLSDNNLGIEVNGFGTALVNKSSLANNGSLSSGLTYGGGIVCAGGGIGIYSSTLSGNVAEFGGGIFSTCATTIVDSTLSGNSASVGGGGINMAGSSLILFNSIVANSPSGGDCLLAGVSGQIENNLIEGATCGAVDGVDNNIVGPDPLLGPLQDNGGATFTHALLPGSPAIATGDANFSTDQRGITRPQGIADDIGAFEAFDAFDCGSQPWLVIDEGTFIGAISCFNAQTVVNNYNISLVQDINTTINVPAFDNPTTGISLLLNGHGFVVEGAIGTRPLSIRTNSTVTIENISFSRANP